MSLQKFVAIQKVRLARGYSYVSTFAIPFLVARELERVAPILHWYYTFPVAAVFIWIAGFVDTEKGFYEAESEFGFLKNPKWMKHEEKFLKELPTSEQPIQKTTDENNN